jgi:cysteinyl-tRNA synthetase
MTVNLSEIKVYDSLTRKKQPLLPPGQGELGVYLCGPTVYQRIHIGNARTFAMFALLVRYLRFAGLEVRFVSNVTDVNDKIYAAAQAQGIASSELAKTATQWYLDDMAELGVGGRDIDVSAVETMPKIIAFIEQLVAAGAAYEANGDVYFSVSSFPDYGKLSNRQLDDMRSGGAGRDDLEGGDNKRDVLDFALWKATKAGEDTSWDSPWGKGRPGWHIECSAMAHETLGASFDVHAGGLDLIFPHHENEIAQSRAAGDAFARLWMHGGMLEIAGDKMSKSDGNIATLREVLDEWPAHVIVWFFLTASYRNPLDFSQGALEEAQKAGQRVTESLRRSERYLGSVETRDAGNPDYADPTINWEGIHEALADDFNTPSALAELSGLVHDLNTAVNEHATPQLVRNLRATILEFLEVFALEGLKPGSVDISDEARELLSAREAARQKKDFEAADRIRDELAELGYVVRDTADGADVVSSDDEDGDGDGDDDGSDGDGAEAGDDAHVA